jgi:Flp pilus assembly protein TadG
MRLVREKHRWMASKIGRALRDDRGSQLVEFAVSLLLLLMVIFSVLDLSRAMYSYEFVTYAAQEGARYAIVRGYDWTGNCSTSAPPSFTLNFKCIASSTDVQNYVKNLTLPLINRSNVTVTTTWPGTTPNCTSACSACSGSNKTNSKGCMVNVKVSYSFTYIAPFLPRYSMTFNGTSQKPIQE